MDILPNELLTVIFHQLSIKHLTQLCLVNRRWNLITDDQFWKQIHLVRFGPTKYYPAIVWRSKVLTNRLASKRISLSENICWWAIRKGYICLVKKLFTKEEIVTKVKTNWGPALLNSVINSDVFGAQEMLQLLVKYINPNLLDDKGYSPLITAVDKNQIESCELLLNFGADIEFKHNGKYTALYRAACLGHKKILITLLHWGANPNTFSDLVPSAIYIAAEKGHLSCVKELCEIRLSPKHTNKTCNIELPFKSKYTALYVASEKGHTKIVKYLLSRGAKVEGNVGQSLPLNTATEKGHTKIVKLLLQAGSNPNKVNVNGSTPLYVASGKGYSQIVTYLLDAGANPNIAYNGCSALSCAAAKGYIEIVEKLAIYGINIKNQDGSNALYHAVDNNHKSVITYLINEGITLNDQAYKGHTPLHLAVLKDNLEIVKLLTEKGADVSIRSGEGPNPIMLATQQNKYPIVNYFVDYLINRVKPPIG